MQRLEIIFYEFIHGKIGKESQRLKNHTLFVNCLFFMKKSNSFVSGGGDSAIIIWILSQDNKWVAQQTLSEHTSYVSSIMMNKMEDYLISGSGDFTLKFWKVMNGNWKCQQSIKTTYCARNMSLNKMEDKLIVCENNYQSFSRLSCIEVLMQNNDKSQWGIVQTFKFDNLGWRLCFTIGDQFAFATQKSDFLEIYNYDTIQKELQMLWQLQINNIKDCCNGFPCQYIESLHILTFKHGNSLKIIKVNDNYSYELMNEVQFSCNEIYGRMSDDGKYIVTWEKAIREIQIRKIQYLE